MTETTIAQLGLGGLALGIVFWFVRWICKHLDENNKVLARNAEVIYKNTKATDENIKVTKELVTYFKSLNGSLKK